MPDSLLPGSPAWVTLLENNMLKDTLSPYSFDEASNCGEGFPKRGTKCQKCSTFIPSFVNFGENEIQRWKHLLHTKGPKEADRYIMSITGCNSRWAKIWRLHPEGPKLKIAPLDNSASCPFCNGALRTKNAMQCPHCFKSWRDQ